MRLTGRAKGLLALAGGLFVAAYAFQRLAPALVATGLAAYLVYAKLRFAALIEDAGFAADVDGPRRTVFQDRTVRLSYRIRVHPPGVRARFSFPDREDLSVEEVRAEPRDVYPSGTLFELEADVRPGRRGRFRLDELHVDVAGPDGLLEQGYTVGVPLEFTAQAPRSAMQEGAHMRELQELAASPQASPGDVSLELLTHRTYRPSDRDRDIDWKVSARRQELLSRIHRQEVDRELVILLDATRPMRYQREGRSMLDHVAKLAVAMVHNAHKQGTDVGIAAFDEQHVLAHHRASADRSVPRRAAQLVAELPDPLPVTGDELVVPDVREAPEEEPSPFEQTVASFRGTGDRVPHGLAEAVDTLHREAHPRTYVVFTAHTHRPSQAETILSRLARGPNQVLVVAPFAPFYLGADRELQAADLVEVNEAWRAHKARLARLEAAGVDSTHLSPDLRARDLAEAARGGPG